jgi:hypothetical protein
MFYYTIEILIKVSLFVYKKIKTTPMSLFSKKPSVRQNDFSNSNMIIKTMQDDINALEKTIYPENPTSENTSSQFSPPIQAPIQNTHPTTPVSQSPFIMEELTREEQPSPHNKPQESLPHIMTDSIDIKKFLSLKTTLLLIVCIVLISIGGIYYFITTRVTSDQTPSIQQPIIDTTQLKTNPTPITLFSTESPNYLSLNTQTSNPQSIRDTLIQTAKQAVDIQNNKLIEFLVTDENNTPLSFEKFASLSNISLSQSVVSLLGEAFSLFVYVDNQTPHIGLSITLKDKNQLQMAMKQEEPHLIQELSPLFLDDTPTISIGIFNNGIYKNTALRFINLHPETSLSLDYAILENNLVIGTSMSMHHALLDFVQ